MPRPAISQNASRVKGGKKPGITRKNSKEDANLTIRLSNIGIIKRTPSEFELQIQGVRIGHVLDSTIEKLQMAVCLPRLIRKDACQLRHLMQPKEVEFILAICGKYTELSTRSIMEKSSLTQLLSSIDKISLHDPRKKYANKYATAKDFENLIDPHMAQVMEMLWNTRSLREKVLKEFPLIEKNPSTVFVNCLISLKDVANYKIGMTAIQDRAREVQLAKAWKANWLLEENILNAQDLLVKQRKELGAQLEVKKRIVRDYQEKIATLEKKFNHDIRHKVQDSERDMAEDCQASILRQADLSAEVKAVTQQYENLLHQHLVYERSLRAKRFKVESQLCTWLTKYDSDIGERQAEFEEITKGYEEEKLEMGALQLRFNEQEQEYVQLMAEKAAEEQRILNEMALQFSKNRSARKIQRYWRAYRQRKIDRKKAKKAKAKAKKEKSAEKAEEEAGSGEVAAAPPPPPQKVGKDKKGGKGKAKGKGKKETAPPPEAAPEEVANPAEEEEPTKTEIVVNLSGDLSI